MYTTDNGKCPTHPYNMSTTSYIFRESLLILPQILSRTTLSHFMETDCIKVTKEINDKLQHLSILGTP
jgi:hypothetical protein